MRIFVYLLLLFVPYLVAAQEATEPEFGNEAVSPEDDTYRVLVNLFDGWQLINYAKVGQNAVVGGDMVLGTHAEIQEQNLANLLTLLGEVDRSGFTDGDTVSLLDDAMRLLENTPDFKAATQKSTQLWPSKRIPYVVAASITDDELKGKIQTAINLWNTMTIIELVPASAGDRNVLVFEDAAGDGWVCQAWLGYYSSRGGQIEINPACSQGAVIHEIGHALGIMHEHSRFDRDQFIATRPFAESSPNYQTIGAVGSRTTYDLCSVMHYSNRQAAADQVPWFELTEAGRANFNSCKSALPPGCRQVGQRCTLSPADVAFINAVYRDR